MKIALISPLPPPVGGIALWTSIICDYLKKECIELMVVNIAPTWKKIYDTKRVLRIVGGSIQLVCNTASYIKILLKRPYLVHMTSSGSLGILRDIVFCVTAKMFNVPFIYHIHHGRVPEIIKMNSIESKLLYIVIRLANASIVITKETYNELTIKFSNKAIYYVPNPAIKYYDEQPICNIDSNMVLFLGWVIPTKGIEELIEVWHQLGRQEWKLYIAGPGNLANIRSLLCKYESENIHYMGEVPHDKAIKLINECSIFVLPSHEEGFPMVLLEAMSLSKPVIATRVGAIPQLLANECGIIIPKKDKIALKNALLFLIENKEMRIKIGNNALNKIRSEYTIDIIFNKYKDIWQKHSGERIFK